MCASGSADSDCKHDDLPVVPAKKQQIGTSPSEQEVSAVNFGSYPGRAQEFQQLNTPNTVGAANNISAGSFYLRLA